MLNSENLTFQTQRLKLRYLKDHDAEDIFNYAKNPNVSRYTTFDTHKSIDDAHSYLKMAKALNKKYPLSIFGIVLKDEGKEKVIGTIGLTPDIPNFLRLQLGYSIGEEWWGNGYAYEASHLLLNYAFSTTDTQCIYATCIRENFQSARVLEKLSMQREGLHKKAILKNGAIYDRLSYSILRQEWELSNEVNY